MNEVYFDEFDNVNIHVSQQIRIAITLHSNAPNNSLSTNNDIINNAK